MSYPASHAKVPAWQQQKLDHTTNPSPLTAKPSAKPFPSIGTEGCSKEPDPRSAVPHVILDGSQASCKSQQVRVPLSEKDQQQVLMPAAQEHSTAVHPPSNASFLARISIRENSSYGSSLLSACGPSGACTGTRRPPAATTTLLGGGKPSSLVLTAQQAIQLGGGSEAAVLVTSRSPSTGEAAAAAVVGQIPPHSQSPSPSSLAWSPKHPENSDAGDEDLLLLKTFQVVAERTKALASFNQDPWMLACMDALAKAANPGAALQQSRSSPVCSPQLEAGATRGKLQEAAAAMSRQESSPRPKIKVAGPPASQLDNPCQDQYQQQQQDPSGFSRHAWGAEAAPGAQARDGRRAESLAGRSTPHADCWQVLGAQRADGRTATNQPAAAAAQPWLCLPDQDTEREADKSGLHRTCCSVNAASDSSAKAPAVIGQRKFEGHAAMRQHQAAWRNVARGQQQPVDSGGRLGGLLGYQLPLLITPGGASPRHIQGAAPFSPTSSLAKGQQKAQGEGRQSMFLASRAQQLHMSGASAAVKKAVGFEDGKAGVGGGAGDGDVAGGGMVNLSAVSGRMLGGKMGRTGDRGGPSAGDAGVFECSNGKGSSHEDHVFASSMSGLHMVQGSGLRSGSSGQALDQAGFRGYVDAASDGSHSSGDKQAAHAAGRSLQHAGEGAIKDSATAVDQAVAAADQKATKDSFLAAISGPASTSESLQPIYRQRGLEQEQQSPCQLQRRQHHQQVEPQKHVGGHKGKEQQQQEECQEESCKGHQGDRDVACEEQQCQWQHHVRGAVSAAKYNQQEQHQQSQLLEHVPAAISAPPDNQQEQHQQCQQCQQHENAHGAYQQQPKRWQQQVVADGDTGHELKPPQQVGAEDCKEKQQPQQQQRPWQQQQRGDEVGTGPQELQQDQATGESRATIMHLARRLVEKCALMEQGLNLELQGLVDEEMVAQGKVSPGYSWAGIYDVFLLNCIHEYSNMSCI